MVRLAYNIIQNLLILLLWPIILLFVSIKEKYRVRFWLRCGLGLKQKCGKLNKTTPRFWIHALSVGELSSVVALVRALRKAYPDATIFLSNSTTAGSLYAKKRLTGSVDAFVDFPYDQIFIVRYFISILRPDLFIQVETDFWPNILAEMNKAGVASFLVNGRVSLSSFAKYQNYPSLFLPLFNSFTCLGMQTVADVERMASLGVPPQKLEMPGNLKIDAAMPSDQNDTPEALVVFPFKRLIVLGSTHPGEEAELAPTLDSIKMAYPDVCFVVAPRDIRRGAEIVKIFESQYLKSCCRSECLDLQPDIDCLVLDTMGELVSYYKQAYAAFIGGTLQPFGGHNPLEPAAFGVPVFFGPHMEDFEDICNEMLAEKSAVQVTGGVMLAREMCSLLKNKERAKELGQAGLDYIIKRQGVTKRHLDIVDRLLCERSKSI